MTSALIGLFAQILAYPHDDVYRHGFADALLDCDEEKYAAWSEFIRVQLEHATMPDPAHDRHRMPKHAVVMRRAWLEARWRDLLRQNWTEWNPKWEGVEFDFRRGFVDEIRLTLAAFAGRECERCRGQGEIGTRWNGLGDLLESTQCPACFGSGHIRGVAAEVFRKHPVTRVVLTNRDPVFYRALMRHGWARTTNANAHTLLRHSLPPALFDALPHPSDGHHQERAIYLETVTYPTPQEATDALITACVKCGREQAEIGA